MNRLDRGWIVPNPMINIREVFTDAVIMAPMTVGSNLPYRRLCNELGASVTMSEMVVATTLLKGRKSEYALIRRAPDERWFGVQIAGSNAEVLAEAARIIESRGADFIDLNCGCPIDQFTRKGLGSALLQKPAKLARIVGALVAAVKVPVTVKIRLGYDDDHLNHREVAKAVVEVGAAAITVHGRTRTQRYRKHASWEAIGEVVQSVAVPVIGNGDILFPHEIGEFRARAGCAGVMIARGALIKPWIFREALIGAPEDPTPAERIAILRRYVALAREHFADSDHGRHRLREFVLWHLKFWCRYAPRRPDGSYPTMQEREEHFDPRSPLEAHLWRNDQPALDWVATLLIDGDGVAGPAPEPVSAEPTSRELIPEG